mgnify:CR=1 FL=1
MLGQLHWLRPEEMRWPVCYLAITPQPEEMRWPVCYLAITPQPEEMRWPVAHGLPYPYP